MTYALGYQNIAQLYHQYGMDGGDAVLGSVGAMVFLPGVDQRTAEYASKRLGTTTVLQASSVDVHDGAKLDQERSTEVGRALMDAERNPADDQIQTGCGSHQQRAARAPDFPQIGKGGSPATFRARAAISTWQRTESSTARNHGGGRAG
jgi:hypothetical protein